MVDYEKQVEENEIRNEKYLVEFKEWLTKKGLTSKTIRKHLFNVKFYINVYLTRYRIIKVEDGTKEVFSYLDDWFIRKCTWSTEYGIKETAASLKKFYKYMSENGYVSEEDYKDLCDTIKCGMDEFLESLEAYDNGTYYDRF